METKSFVDYAEKRLGKKAVEEIEKKALDELEALNLKAIKSFDISKRYNKEET